MISWEDVKHKFESMEEYEMFSNEWSKICYFLKPSLKNKKMLERSEKALAIRRELKENGKHD